MLRRVSRDRTAGGTKHQVDWRYIREIQYTMQPEKIIIHTIKATQKYQHKTYLTKCNLILSHRHNIFFKQKLFCLRDSEDLHGFYILWMCFYKIVYWVIVLYWYFCIYFNLMYAYYFGLSGESSSYDALWCRCSMMSKPVSMSAACSYVPWHPSHHEWKCNPEVCRPLTLPSHAFALHAYKFVTNKL